VFLILGNDDSRSQEPAVLAAAAETGFFIERSPVLMEGRLELLHYYRQQSASINHHRYGNLGFRAADFPDG
jgi:RHH-type proline utilization regulon transcriptional repressor/proline dehydrogenase/delta 1-pyrroline-5-carboxylate dehydrogenase